ncbi:MAG TPA: XrtA system polysaccharide deacetylase [Rhizomicrobium sp.]|jgi:polysaccharide deacetylase family protein (PEP-CTERM system associated)|nr:XrtA system polysaccharide deacetylase [Rhizomicrobium sp.]
MTLAAELDTKRGTSRIVELAGVRTGARADPCVNAFTVDVEDYFQVEAFKDVVDQESWEDRPSRVEENTERVLGILEAADVRATFFVLGWVAERFPLLVRSIQANGHEVASHGHGHEMASVQTQDEFRNDVRRAKRILEDCIGVRVRGFRAPTFSIGRKNWWTYEILVEEGYVYSSSIYPIAHDLYGMPTAPRTPFHPLETCDFVEIPVATVRLLGANRPCGGGGYFRLMPYALSRWFIDRVNRLDAMPCVFYCHPWEFDVGQPRIEGASMKSQLRHHLNIAAMERRIARLLGDFAWGRIDENYLTAGEARPRKFMEWRG